MKPIKIGYLQEDLYTFHSGFDIGSILYRSFPEKEKEELVLKFQNQFEVIAKKGTQLFCYLRNSREVWMPEGNRFSIYGEVVSSLVGEIEEVAGE